MNDKRIKETMKIWQCSEEEAKEIILEEEIEKGFEENAFCDNTGFCNGTSCKYYKECKGI